MTGKILIIEDNLDVVRVLERTAAELGFEHDSALDGQSGLERARKNRYDLLLIDINLPLLDGFQVCENLRRDYPNLPIIMITSRGGERDRVEGLTIGADDYIVKPFSTRELAARINALLRRVRNSQLPADGVIKQGPLSIDTKNLLATLNGTPLELTILEFQLLAYLASRPNKIVSRKELMENLWGYEDPEFGRSITTYLCRLRAKVEENPAKPSRIRTVYGGGYRFVAPADE